MKKIELTIADLEKIKSELVFGSPMYQFCEGKIKAAAFDADLVKREWDSYCGHFGLKPTDFGRTFTIKRRQYKVVGINPSAPTFPVHAERMPDGRRFRVPATLVR